MCGWMGGEMPVAVMAGDIRWEVTHQGDIAWWVVSASLTPLLQRTTVPASTHTSPSPSLQRTEYLPLPPLPLSEDYLLGRFQRESVNVINATSGTAVTLEDLDLLPNLRVLLLQQAWPYVKQVYPGGETG